MLNAFRHQRSKQSAIVSIEGTFTVLNAFRHQRSKQTGEFALFWSRNPCSTPFGIRDRNRALRARSPGVYRVLNAFRHQRSKQPASSPRKTSQRNVLNAFRHQRSKQVRLIGIRNGGHMCSTPFGIRDRNRPGIGLGGSTQQKCSTPFGIRDRNSAHDMVLYVAL